MDCPYLETCPIFKNLATKEVWINQYCKKNPDECARKQIREKGEMVPAGLLPNGKKLSIAS